MMKVAIAGSNGLAQMIANFIETTTSHQFVLLSRRVCPWRASCQQDELTQKQTHQGLTQRGWQILVTDYENSADLQFKLAGVDVVISTITGRAQLALIDAAAVSHVRRFIASEFAGLPSSRPINDPFDQGRHIALQRLAHLAPSGMISTVFSCGIFYERFGVGGMAAAQLGLSSHIAGEGEYLMSFRHCRAEIPYNSIAIPPPYVCMTSAQDVARAVVAALDLTSWPEVFQLRGDRLTVEQIVGIAEQVRGTSTSTNLLLPFAE